MSLLASGNPQVTSDSGLVISGVGSVMMELAAELASGMSEQELYHYLLAIHAFDWNKSEWELVNRLEVEERRKIWLPKETMPGYPNGYAGDAEAALLVKAYWKEKIEAVWHQTGQRSTNAGDVGGVVIHLLSMGGHMLKSEEDIRWRVELFPKMKAIAVLPLTTNRALWRNVRRHRDWPESLNTPMLVVDGVHKHLIITALVQLIITFAGAKEIAIGNKSLLEVIGELGTYLYDGYFGSLGLAVAWKDIAIIPYSKWKILWKEMKGEEGRFGISIPELMERAASAIFEALQPKARLIHGPEPDPADPQYIGINARGRRSDGKPMTPKEREDYENGVLNIVKAKMRAAGRTYPEGLTVVWHSVLQPGNHGYARVYAVRLFGIPGRTAREYVDEMLAKDERFPVGK